MIRVTLRSREGVRVCADIVARSHNNTGVILSAPPQHSVLSASVTELDVAIVGAGPAGAAAALALGGSGLAVGIIEKATLPRHKTCGGGVLRRAVALLPLDIRAAIQRECFAAELVHHSPPLRFFCQRDEPIISMVMRDRFDHLLTRAAEHAGAQLFAGVTVTDVAGAEDCVNLETSAGRFRARFVIAADGANSVVARKVKAAELRNVVPALECEVTLPAEEMNRFMEAARFDFGFVPAGYAWVFPKREHLSIGVLTTKRGGANLPEEYRRYLDHLAIRKTLHEDRRGYIIPCHPRARLFDTRRVLFVGDAAGLVDPVTAEGITAGILSGQLAAQAMVEGKCEERAVKRVYRETLRHGLLKELRIARWLAGVLYDCPKLRGGLLSRHGQRVSELITQIVVGETSYSAAVHRPRNYLKLFLG